MRRVLAFGAAAVLLIATAAAAAGAAQTTTRIPGDSPWYTTGEGEARVDFYFFWSSTCPHCREAKPFIETLPDRYPWLDYHAHQVDAMTEEGRRTADLLSAEVGEELRYVPAFFFCETLSTGYDAEDTTGADIARRLEECHARLVAGLDPRAEDDELRVPLLGVIDPDEMGLPMLTVVLGGLDAFNPCAFFVLLFLLSLLVHARSRGRMLVIGGIFVFFSGFIYFLFMAAWLNLFNLVGPLRWVTALAGAVAVTLAAVNIKDYFWYRRGPSLGISDEARPRLFKRMRALTAAAGFPSVIAGTVALAVAANSYELLCTAGFPLVYTKVLTLSDLPTATYYGYLLAYNIVYVLPLLAIVGLFVWRRGSRKLQEQEGRALKLLSGVMMLGLGIVLLVRPALLDNVLTALALLAVAVVVTATVVLVERSRRSTPARSR